jgi:hypothetical protein
MCTGRGKPNELNRHFFRLPVNGYMRKKKDEERKMEKE